MDGESRLRPTIAALASGFPRPRPGQRGDPGLFPPGSVVRRVTTERALILVGGRALLMQIAHPMVAAGVADHSDFSRSPWDRLWGTLDAVLTVVFGDSAQLRAVGDRVAASHDGVTGERGGARYRALDPELLLWVHATLVDSALVAWERFVGPLPASLAEDYYEEMKRFALIFRVPTSAIPADLEAFRTYVERMIAGLEVSADARTLAVSVLAPPAPPPLRPAVALQRFVTIGLLPERLRGGFGLAWSPARERGLESLAAAIREVRPLLPAVIRHWPHARELARRMETAEPRDTPRRTAL